MRRTLVCHTSLLLCAIVAFAASTASAQNFSGLLNAQLTPASSVEDSVGDLLGQLIGGGTRGALERVTVIEDSEQVADAVFDRTGRRELCVEKS